MRVMDRTTLNGIRGKFRSLSPALDERQRRLWAASEARAMGHGGLALVLRATGIAKTTVLRGMEELASGHKMQPGRVRRPGGGRKLLTTLDPQLARAMERLGEPVTRGDPESPLRWTDRNR